MITRVLPSFAVCAAPAYAQEWSKLTGAQIEEALDDTKLRYTLSEQVFYASGRTLYDNGRPSWGYWRVQGDQYCSQWPPADGWACYDMDRHSGDGRLRFVSETGAMTEGSIVE